MAVIERSLDSHIKQERIYSLYSTRSDQKSFKRLTLLTNVALLNRCSWARNFCSRGLKVLIAALTGFQRTSISSRIYNLSNHNHKDILTRPLAGILSFLSFRPYHRFSQFLIFSRGMATFPRNSTFLFGSSSNTVISRTSCISITALECTVFYLNNPVSTQLHLDT